MKKKTTVAVFLAAVAVVLLLNGCTPGAVPSAEPVPSQSTTSAAPAPSQSVPPEPLPVPSEPAAEPVLLDGAEPVSANVWRVSNPWLETMESPELKDFRGNILAWGVSFADVGGDKLVMRLISAADGSLLGEQILGSSGMPHVQVCGEFVGVCDAGRGEVLILDSRLDTVEIYQYPASGETWCLSRDLSTLYILSWVDGICAVELESGETRSLSDSTKEFYVRTMTDDYAAFSYIDPKTQKYAGGILELSTGEILPVPCEGDWTVVYRRNDADWLLGGVRLTEGYVLLRDGEQSRIFWTENRFAMLLPQGHLMKMYSSGHSASLYDLTGSHVSTCELPGDESCYIGDGFLWSDLYGGYFFMDYERSRFGTLCFWDVSIPTEGEDLPLVPVDDPGAQGTAADPSLYERAEEMSDRFGVEILIADQCLLDYEYFNSYAVTDTGFVTAALDVMERALSAYPEGFLVQLQYGNIRSIRFELVGGLTPKKGTGYTGSYGGFAHQGPDYYQVVMDAFMMSEKSIYHEIAHIIDARLAWDAYLRENALFSEETWMSLQPAGFVYAETYGDLPPEYGAWSASGYFVSDYACRYPTEDRATMMESAMAGFDSDFRINPYLCDKLRYYSDCIRDCFDTEGWPEVTVWEKILQ